MDTLELLYGTAPGRLLLKPLTSRGVSAACGRFLDSRFSRVLVRPFVRRAGIDRGDYLPDRGRSFNDFFCRPIRPEKRPVDRDPSHLVAPCDGLLTVYPIREGLVVPVKQSRYRIEDLVRSRSMAKNYDGGWCLVFRLRVDHYHRYVYAETGRKGRDCHIRGVYHTVQPVALRRGPVFCENSRVFTEIVTERWGRLLQMEVGAMLVGRIVNWRPFPADVKRGEEKGCFQYGGSTIVLLVEPGRFLPREDLTDHAETPVRLGEALGLAATVPANHTSPEPAASAGGHG